MDSMGHVNNVMYNRYAESARVNWTRNFAASDPEHETQWMELMTPKGVGLILRSITTDYKFPMQWPDRVTVLHKLRSKPQSDADHFLLDVVILSERHRRPAARCIEDIVVYDYNKAKKSPLAPFMVTKFREIFDLQEQAKERYSGRVRGLLDRVEQLEKSSWDKKDAVEDVGGT
ncbi:thioesterase-like superfamily-domain-containing protein [Phaeosphaeriaceae sp. PMI808]|nr:thioesterase-like superfamily-domain-containing protein [Phaeosphaeriaceae sp. PMI808]